MFKFTKSAVFMAVKWENAPRVFFLKTFHDYFHLIAGTNIYSE